MADPGRGEPNGTFLLPAIDGPLGRGCRSVRPCGPPFAWRTMGMETGRTHGSGASPGAANGEVGREVS